MNFSRLLLLSIGAVTTLASDPLGLYAKANGVFHPLSNTYAVDNGMEDGIMCYGYGIRDPIEVTLKGKMVYWEDEGIQQLLGRQSGNLVFAPKTRGVYVDEDMRLQPGPFYSCVLFPEIYYISMDQAHTHDPRCFQVEIYLMPYDKATAYPLKLVLSEGEENYQFNGMTNFKSEMDNLEAGHYEKHENEIESGGENVSRSAGKKNKNGNERETKKKKKHIKGGKKGRKSNIDHVENDMNGFNVLQNNECKTDFEGPDAIEKLTNFMAYYKGDCHVCIKPNSKSEKDQL